MISTSWGDGVVPVSDAPREAQRLDLESSAWRARGNKPTEEFIDCPGGCGGVARLEAPLSVTRNGKTRHLRMAECCSECKVEQQSPVSRKSRIVAARFEIPWNEHETVETAAANSEDRTEVSKMAEQPRNVNEHGTDRSSETNPHSELAATLNRAITSARLTQTEAGQQIGCSQSSVSKILRGCAVAEHTAEAALDWARTVLSSSDSESVIEPVSEVEIEPEHEPESEPTMEEQRPFPTLDGLPQRKPQRELTPYEAILRKLLEEVAQQRLQEIAGDAAKGISARVTLEWNSDE